MKKTKMPLPAQRETFFQITDAESHQEIMIDKLTKSPQNHAGHLGIPECSHETTVTHTLTGQKK